MNFFLTISLFAILIGTVIATNFDLIHPSVIFSALWFFSSFLWLFMASQWKEYCSLKAYFFIVLNNLVCVFCMIVFTKVKFKLRGKIFLTSDTEERGEKEGSISRERKRIIVILLFIFYIAATRMMLSRIGELATLASRYDSSTNSLYLARISEINGQGYGQLYVNIMRINIAIGIILAKRVVEKVLNNERNYKIYIPFIVYAVFFSIIRGSRNDMMYLLGAYMFFIIFYLYKRVKNRRKSAKKALKVLLIIMVTILVVWSLSGLIFGRKGSSVTRSLITYVGGPIAGLNILLDKPNAIESDYFGQNTFDSVYAMLSRLRLLSFKRASVYLPYVGNGIFRINVFTMYGRYFSDFGYSGTVILTVLFSIFYGGLYKKVLSTQNTRNEKRFMLIYSCFMYPLIMAFFEEKFFCYINNTVFLVVFTLLLDWLMFSAKSFHILKKGASCKA